MKKITATCNSLGHCFQLFAKALTKSLIYVLRCVIEFSQKKTTFHAVLSPYIKDESCMTRCLLKTAIYELSSNFKLEILIYKPYYLSLLLGRWTCSHQQLCGHPGHSVPTWDAIILFFFFKKKRKYKSFRQLSRRRRGKKIQWYKRRMENQ